MSHVPETQPQHASLRSHPQLRRADRRQALPVGICSGGDGRARRSVQFAIGEGQGVHGVEVEGGVRCRHGGRVSDPDHRKSLPTKAESGNEVSMNFTALLFNAVRHFRGPQPEDSNGAAGLAPYMGITATSLSHKVSPTYPSAHCSPEEVVNICKLTGDHETVRAMAKELGYAMLPITVPACEGGAAHAKRMAASVKEFGEFLAETAVNAADGHINDNEMARITREFMESMAAQTGLYAALKAMHQASKPPSERAMVELPVRSMASEAA